MFQSEQSAFAFVLCQAGAETALKRELQRSRPELRLAYSRPGFVTFKHARGLVEPGFALDSPFARVHGVSLGKANLKTATEAEVRAGLIDLGRRLEATHLHVVERDRWLPGDEPPGHVHYVAAEALRRRILADDATQIFAREGLPSIGAVVLDLVLVEEEEWWLGAHLHQPGRSPHPGGRPRLDLPAAAPSRAFLKIEEAIAWSAAPVQSGDVALELGSAPGGACFSLLERGLEVIGVDTADMDARVLGATRFRHVRKAARSVTSRDLPARLDWLLVDLNLAPRIAVEQTRRFAGMRDLAGAFITLKLGDWAEAERLPKLHAELMAAGFAQVRFKQLSSHRQELLAYALTERGQGR